MSGKCAHGFRECKMCGFPAEAPQRDRWKKAAAEWLSKRGLSRLMYCDDLAAVWRAAYQQGQKDGSRERKGCCFAGVGQACPVHER